MGKNATPKYAAGRFRCHTAAEVIESIGGLQKVARRFQVDPRVVWNWKVRGFPPDTFYAFRYQLRVSAPPSLWHQREIPFCK